jgi:hypothetical protein
LQHKKHRVKKIKDCPVGTIKLNATCGQSFVFFAQVKAAGTLLNLNDACGGCDSILGAYWFCKLSHIKALFF